jgi:hypothetical protein
MEGTDSCTPTGKRSDSSAGHSPATYGQKRWMFLRKMDGEVLQDPCYTPDLVPSDIHIIGPLKESLGAQKLEHTEQARRTGSETSMQLGLRIMWESCVYVWEKQRQRLLLHMQFVHIGPGIYCTLLVLFLNVRISVDIRILSIETFTVTTNCMTCGLHLCNLE